MLNELTEAGQKAEEVSERGLANEHMQEALAKAKKAGKTMGDEAKRMGGGFPLDEAYQSSS